MITDRDIADKRNEVLMLRLQIDEHKARRRLDEISQQEDTIDTYKDAVASQNKVLKDFQDEINKKDTTIDEDKMEAVRLLVECENDWILHTDSEATEVRQQEWTINKLNALLADEKMTLAAYRNNPLSDQVADRDKRIEQLTVLNEALCIDVDGRDKHIETLKSTVDFGQSRIDLLVEKKSNCIDELMKDIDARNQVIASLRVDRHGKQDIIDKLRHDSCNLNDKLARIEKIIKKARTFGDVIDRVSANHIAIGEINTIIQEE